MEEQPKKIDVIQSLLVLTLHNQASLRTLTELVVKMYAETFSRPEDEVLKNVAERIRHLEKKFTDDLVKD